MMDGMLGHNNPPDPIDEALGPYGDTISEVENWLDGTAVETEGQMKQVDALLKAIKAAKKAVETAEETEAKPIYDAWKLAKDRYKPTLTDLDRMAKGLVAIVDTFKRKLAAEKAEAERKARAEAERKMREAHAAAQAADVANIDAQRAAEAARIEAERAVQAAKEAAKDTVKGLRTVWKHEVTDHKALLHWIARNDKDVITRFVEEYARAHFKQGPIDGVKAWQEKEAF
jgi:hypothetical protein